MGGSGWGPFMSGIGCVLASASSPPAGGGGTSGPLSCTVAFSGGAGTTAVSGASGFVSGLVQTTDSGGTPPYAVQVFAFENEPSGKLALVDGPSGSTNITYTGFVLNEIESGAVRYTIKDSAGGTATARYPASGTLSIMRTS